MPPDWGGVSSRGVPRGWCTGEWRRATIIAPLHLHTHMSPPTQSTNGGHSTTPLRSNNVPFLPELCNSWLTVQVCEQKRRDAVTVCVSALEESSASCAV